MIKRLFWILGAIFVLIVVLILAIIAPIDYDSSKRIMTMEKSLSQFDNLQYKLTPEKGRLFAGHAKVNITPPSPQKMAGYGPRGPYTSVQDSLYAGIIIFDNGHTRLLIITVDLILFPRILKKRLQQELSKLGYGSEQVFFSASHTHNGFGNWDNSIAGSFAFGTYDQTVIDRLFEQIYKGIQLATEELRPASVGFQKIDAGKLVSNRLDPINGDKDPYLRVLSILYENNQIALLVTYSGHATNLDADIWAISGDYPGVLVSALQEVPSIEFAMFCSGMVASHNIDIDIPKGPKRIEHAGKALASLIINHQDSIVYADSVQLGGLDVELELPASQLRITRNLHVRDWIFDYLFEGLNANIKSIKIGDNLLIGMPCDYSGELSNQFSLDSLADSRGMNLMVTSFNGNYVGYITADQYYNHSSHDEVTTMNWVGPGMGAFFSISIIGIIKSADDL